MSTPAAAGPPAPRAEARRLTGPSWFGDAPGAALDVTWRGAPLPDDAALDELAGRWRAHVGALLAAAGPGDPPAADRSAWAFAERRSGDARTRVLSLYAAAGVDQLDAAVEAAEWAWAAARDAASPPEEAAEAVRRALRRTPLPALLRAAESRGVTATWDDDGASVGVGARSRTWPADALPDPGAVPWGALGDVPVALVTGSNGKTTTTRLLAAMLRAAGHTVGVTSTDGVRVEAPDGSAEELETGDWSGPGGARLALRHPRVTAAALETARGGLLRRGLAVRRAAAAAVTNIAADHFGDYGVFDLEALADAKLVVARALVATRGPLVLSADDATLRRRVAGLAGAPFPIVWTVTDGSDADARRLVAAHVAAGGRAVAVSADVAGEAVLRWHDGRAWHALAPVGAVALAAGGAARHNVANAATSAALALAMGVAPAAVADALRTFGAAPGDNPGRLEVLPVGDVTAVVDYAHNPAGLTALLDAAAPLGRGPDARHLLVLGQAGDRDDAALAELAAAAWRHGSLDAVLLKDLPAMARGRAPGEVPGVLRAALHAAGAPPEAVPAEVADDEAAVVRRALAWARPGDVLVLPLHVDRAAVVAWLRALHAGGWRAGRPVPTPGPAA